jgi:Flp pilus assembly protein TadD
MTSHRKRKKKRVGPALARRGGSFRNRHGYRGVFLVGVAGVWILLALGVYQSLRAARSLPGITTAYMSTLQDLLDSGNSEHALGQLRLALALDIVNEPVVLNNLANALQSQGKSSEAITFYQRAIRVKPDYAMAHYNLAKALGEQGDRAAAIQLYRKAVRLAPDHVDAHNNLANALAAEGNFDEAIHYYTTALELQPDHVAAHNNLAWALKSVGRRDEALAHFREAVRLRPDQVPSLLGLAWLLATDPDGERRDGAESLAVARHAVQLLPRPDSSALDTLAAAHAAAGEFERASLVAETAMDLAAAGSAEREAIRQRLELYRRGQPYREPS